jgi:hypothetical protein
MEPSNSVSLFISGWKAASADPKPPKQKLGELLELPISLEYYAEVHGLVRQLLIGVAGPKIQGYVSALVSEPGEILWLCKGK